MRSEQAKLETALRRAGEQLITRIKAAGALRSLRIEGLGYLIRRIPFATLVADDSQRYLEANGRASRLLGYSRAQLLALQVPDVVAASTFAATHKRWRGFTSTRVQEGEIALRRRDDSIVVVSYWAHADVLPGMHVSILARTIGTIDEVRPLDEPAAAREGRRRRERTPARPD
jgi:PAS domain-containing protein